jgi:hypothetical protein
MRDNLFGGLCKLFVVVWSAFCLMAASYGFLEGPARIELADYTARVDALMRGGLWAAVRLFPAAAAVVFYLMFGRTQIAVTVMTPAPAAPAKRRFPYVQWRTLFWGTAVAALLVGAVGPSKLVDRARSEWLKRVPPQVAGMLVAAPAPGAAATVATADVAAAAGVAPGAGAPSEAKWKSSKRSNPKDGSELAHALLTSDTSFTDRFGAAHQPKLHIWCTEARTRVYVEVGAPLDAGYDTTTVRVRLDEEKPETISGPGSTNGEAFFFPDPIAMLRRMKGRTSMRVEFPLFREGNPIASFDLRGMEPHVAMIQDTCGWD